MDSYLRRNDKSKLRDFPNNLHGRFVTPDKPSVQVDKPSVQVDEPSVQVDKPSVQVDKPSVAKMPVTSQVTGI